MSDDTRTGETMRDAEIEAMIAWWDEDHDLFDENGDGIQFPDFQFALRQLKRQRDEARAESARLRAALAEIRDAHIPDQPASSGLSDGEWIVEHVRRLRKMALEALRHE